ncbi:MAG TPA: phosphoesterase, partial [Thermoanaerobaculia bacterium]|nr:phosphoesterase [Thermoanaerobaculia bacterium]
MSKTAAMVALAAATCATSSFAVEGTTPRSVPHLDHVFLVMMENHGYSQIVDNPHAVFINNLAKAGNLATNYFAVGHPSL